MKTLKFNLWGILSIGLFFLFSMSTSMAQSSKCDPCTEPWVQQPIKVYNNQTVNGLSPSCTFNLYLTVETRMCNGIPQVRLLDFFIESNNGCQISCWHVGLLMRKVTKLLLQELGGHIIVDKPASCFYLLEFDPSPQFKACLGKESTYFTNWYQALPCGKSCCVTEYQLNASGDVETLNSIAEPCMGVPPDPIPSTITVYCNGVPMTVQVIPPAQPLTCEPSCDNTGDIFSAKIVSVDDEKFIVDALIYPNPAQEIINISNWREWTDVYIYDVAGKLVMKSTVNQESIDIKELPRGYFQMVLSNEDSKQRSIQKFVKE